MTRQLVSRRGRLVARPRATEAVGDRGRGGEDGAICAPLTALISLATSALNMWHTQGHPTAPTGPSVHCCATSQTGGGISSQAWPMLSPN